MSTFTEHNLDSAFAPPAAGLPGALKTFDAFPKTNPTYTTRHARGGQWTVLLLLTSLLLTGTELLRWARGHESHHFSVEKGVAHSLQINLDTVLAMPCSDLHINVQDASGDRILAGDMLRRDPTNWAQWVGKRGVHRLKDGMPGGGGGGVGGGEGDHVGDILAGAAGGSRRKFARTPRVRGEAGACRVFGSLLLNKVQGDFHITARGHGYMDFGQHLDHQVFNFSHIINELSFGPFYPSLVNPLDKTVATTESHFYKFQYYLSVVPTLFSRGATRVATNQYAVTEQSRVVGERMIPGVFFKFDIEPILLSVTEERGGLLALLVRLVNVVSGVLVGGGWCYQLAGWAGDVWGRRGGRKRGEGVLGGRGVGGDGHDD
ncbi:MAG: hypothetical protein M1829_006194 [Trizodia sp. TS-e1964]|nr:MAG: hypothetical protein M1829_006194 [Trizodia sp. TS-e1964]